MQADEKRIITDEELTEIVKVAAKAGADAAMEHFRAEKLKEKRNRKDRRLHNTKLLIRHYRTFKEYVNNAVFEREESNEDALGAIEELMWEPRVTADMVVESIKRSAARTQIIINHIDGMTIGAALHAVLPAAHPRKTALSDNRLRRCPVPRSYQNPRSGHSGR